MLALLIQRLRPAVDRFGRVAQSQPRCQCWPKIRRNRCRTTYSEPWSDPGGRLSNQAEDAGLLQNVGPAFEWIQEIHAKWLKVPRITGHDRKAMYCGDRSNHGVLDQRLGSSVLEPSPFPERRRVRWEDPIGTNYRAQPRFKLCGFVDILFSREFNACLNLANCHSRQIQVIGRHTFRPRDDSWMRTGPTQLRYDVGVQ